MRRPFDTQERARVVERSENELSSVRQSLTRTSAELAQLTAANPRGRGRGAAAWRVVPGQHKGEIFPNSGGCHLGRFPLVSASFWTAIIFQSVLNSSRN